MIDPWFIQLGAALFCGLFLSVGIPILVLAWKIGKLRGRF